MRYSQAPADRPVGDIATRKTVSRTSPRAPGWVDVAQIGPLTTRAGRLGPIWGTLVRIGLANLDMSGIVLDGLTRWRVWVLLSAVTGFIVANYTGVHLTAAGALGLAGVLFVARQSFLLLSFTPRGIAHWLRTRYGVQRGAEAYEGITALFFLYRSYSYSLLVQKTSLLSADWLLPYAPYLHLVGWLMIGLGSVVNTWAFLSIGRPAYYYLDMYYGRFLQPFTHSGLYRLLKNPMYSVGQLPAYGLALFYGSGWGLLFSAANQVCCYVFYYVAERPHIRAVLSRQAKSAPA